METILKAENVDFGFKSPLRRGPTDWKGSQKDNDSLFKSLSFQIKRGEWIAIVGPSGAGKSTFLRLVAGLIEPLRGELKWEKRRPDAPFGFVFQDPHLIPWKCVEENISLPLLLQRKNKKGSRDSENLNSRVQTWLNRVELDSAKRKYPHELSGGMRMRASFARALVSAPEVVFLDEPFSALDERLRMELGNVLYREWLERKKKNDPLTCLMVTHSISEAVLWANKLFLLEPCSSNSIDKIREIEIHLPQERDQNLYRSTEYFEELKRIYSELKRWLEKDV